MSTDPLPDSGIIHLVNIFDEGELRRDATIRKFWIVRTEAEGELVEAATCKDYLQVRLEGVREDSQPRAVDLHFEKTVAELKEMRERE